VHTVGSTAALVIPWYRLWAALAQLGLGSGAKTVIAILAIEGPILNRLPL
jgi:hypothetical protein